MTLCPEYKILIDVFNNLNFFKVTLLLPQEEVTCTVNLSTT